MSTNQDLETMYPQGKEVFIGGENFMIRPFVLKNRTKVIRIFTEVFSEFGKQKDIDKANNNDVIGKFIDTVGDRLIEIYEIVTGKDKEWLENNLRIKEEIELIQVVMEINDFPFLVSQIQKMMGVKK